MYFLLCRKLFQHKHIKSKIYTNYRSQRILKGKYFLIILSFKHKFYTTDKSNQFFYYLKFSINDARILLETLRKNEFGFLNRNRY